MNKHFIAAAALVLATFAHPGSSQVVQPAMTLHKFATLAARHADDGRVQRRLDGATLGLIRVEWPAGTRTTPHNHANELIVFLAEGRLKAFSAGQELTLEPGDFLLVPAYVEHSYEALEDSVTIEGAGPG